jgi:hypothetical protein
MILTKQIEYRGKIIDIALLKPNSDKRILVQCPICNKQRYAHYKSIKDNQICHSCAIITKRSNILIIGQKYGRLTVTTPCLSGKSICICECGTEKTYDNYSIISGHTNSCGCLKIENLLKNGKKIKGVWVGENHPNWKGGISSIRQRFNASNDAKKWRESVFKRDEYTCQSCGQIGGILNAHHIKQFAIHSELRLDINNGITLCEKCHRIEHKINGKKNTKKTTLTK